MRIALLLLSVAVAERSHGQTFRGTIEGPPHDGDTFALRVTHQDRGVKQALRGKTIKIRVWAADAPELRQLGGVDAQRSLARLAPIGVPVTCLWRGKSYDRIVASCEVPRQAGGPIDIAAHQIITGNALVWTSERGKAANWRAWRLAAPSKRASAKTLAEHAALTRLLADEAAAERDAAGMWFVQQPCPAWRYRKGRCG